MLYLTGSSVAYTCPQDDFARNNGFPAFKTEIIAKTMASVEQENENWGKRLQLLRLSFPGPGVLL